MKRKTLSSKLPRPSSWNLKPGTWDLELGTWNLKPSSWNLKPSSVPFRFGSQLLGSCAFWILFSLAVLTACQVSYKLNGSSIDYTKTKTIQITDFPIRSSYVWGPMGPLFNNTLKDQFADHTRLSQVKRNGDLKIEGEITQYQQRNKSVNAESYSAQTELSMTVNVRFTNTKNHNEDFEKQFTATSTYETTQSLASVQEELVTQMCKDICDQIFNATVANW